MEFCLIFPPFYLLPLTCNVFVALGQYGYARSKLPAGFRDTPPAVDAAGNLYFASLATTLEVRSYSAAGSVVSLRWQSVSIALNTGSLKVNKQFPPQITVSGNTLLVLYFGTLHYFRCDTGEFILSNPLTGPSIDTIAPLVSSNGNFAVVSKGKVHTVSQILTTGFAERSFVDVLGRAKRSLGVLGRATKTLTPVRVRNSGTLSQPFDNKVCSRIRRREH